MPLKCGKRNHLIAKCKSKEVKAVNGLGQLDGESMIKLDETVPPVQHAPRRIAVALRPRLKKALDDCRGSGDHTHQVDKLHCRSTQKEWKVAHMS